MTRARYMLFCGIGAAAASLAAVTILARVEERPVLGPVNATSHWLHGDRAARQASMDVDVAHTGVGAITNIGAGFFWGGLFGAYLHARQPAPAQIVRDGAVLGAVAGLLDYGILPRRLSPGWELALSSRSVVLSMAAMAAGATLGGLAARADADTDVPRSEG